LISSNGRELKCVKCSSWYSLKQLDHLDSAILHAMNDALDERVLEASVVAALERIRNEQEKFPDQRVVLERELSLIQTRLHHLVETIANGKSTDSVIASLHREEARRELWFKNYRDSIASLKWSPSTQSVLLRTSEAARENIPTLFARHAPQARQMLRKLLDGTS
jgi:hypothetical protein